MINWYPGHMAKTKRLVREELKFIDIVFVLLDARVPYSSMINDLDDIINNKPKLFIMTKYDLCDKDITDKWLNEYKKDNSIIKVDLLLGKGIDNILVESKKILENFNIKREKRGMKTRKIRALIIGVPNVGKSTLINKLVGRKSTEVGNKPGVTKNNRWVRINDDLELLDTPGILWPKFKNEEIGYNLASTSAIKEEILPKDDVAIYILKKIDKYYKGRLEERYGIDNIDFDDIESIYETIGRKRGALIKGNEVDFDKVTNIIIRDLRDGHLGTFTFDRK